MIFSTALNIAKANHTTKAPEMRIAIGSTNFIIVVTELSTSRVYCVDIFAQTLLMVEVFSHAAIS